MQNSECSCVVYTKAVSLGVQTGLINYAFTVNYTAGLDFKQQEHWLGIKQHCSSI
jgi:hypothetical protein